MSIARCLFFRRVCPLSGFILTISLLVLSSPGTLAQSRSVAPPVSSYRSSPSLTIERPGRDSPPSSPRSQSVTRTTLPTPLSPPPIVLWDNGETNDTGGVASEQDTVVDQARSADDFVLASTSTIHTVVFDIYVETPVTATGAVDIYAHSGSSGPANAPPLTTRTSTDYIVLPFPVDPGFEIRRYTVNFSPPLTLAAGRYWLSGYVLGEGSGRGFFAYSDGAVPSTEQEGYFKSERFSYPDWAPISTFTLSPKHLAFRVLGNPAAKTNVNSNVNLVNTLTGLVGSACPPHYLAQFNINANLVNTGAIPIGDPEFQVVELQHSGGPAPSHPYRLKTADDYLPCHTGGLAGSIQQVSPSPFNLNPGDVIPVFFHIDLPGPVQPRRFRFFVNVFGIPGGVSKSSNTTGMPARQREKLGQLAIEVTGFTANGTPLWSSRFIPENQRRHLRVNMSSSRATFVRR